MNKLEWKYSLEYFDIGFRDYTNIVEEFGRYIYRYSNTIFVDFRV